MLKSRFILNTGDDCIDREVIKALLFFPDSDIQKYSYLSDYMDASELYALLIDLDIIIKKSKLSDRDLLLIKCVKQGKTHRDIAEMLGITRSAVTHKLDAIVEKLHETHHLKNVINM